MNGELSILILEDVATDAELMEIELTEAGLDFTSKRVATKSTFVEALEDRTPDIMLSDYSLPSFDGLSALHIAKSMCPEIPFIFVSGALGEERAIELLKQGATDYVLKNRLSRLAPAVSRALHEVAERNERKRFELELKESEDRYRTIFENTGTATVIVKEDSTIALANREFERLSGYSRSEIVGKKTWIDFVAPDDLEIVEGFRYPREADSGSWSAGIEFRMIGRQDETIHVLANMAIIPSTTETVISLLDITRLRQAEQERREASLYARRLLESSLDPLVTINADGKIMDVNQATELATGLPRERLIGSEFANYFTETDKAQQAYREVFSKGQVRDYPLVMRHVSGQLTDVLYNLTLYRNAAGVIQGVFATARDITERKKMEEALHESEALYQHFFQSSVAGTFRTVYDPSGTSGWHMDCNDAHARILGYSSRQELLNHSIGDSFLNDHDLMAYTHDLMEKRTITNYQFLLKKKDGSPVYVLLNATMHDYRNSLMLVEGTMVDISDWVAAEKKLLDSNENLRTLTSELVMTEERERRRIAVDLHDNIGQTLALTRIKLDSLADVASQCGFTEPLKKIQEMVNQSIQQIRSLMCELSPYVLYELGFKSAIEWLSEQIQTQHDIAIHISNDLTTRPIDEEVQILMFRATRELLLNVVKHAGAKQVWIMIHNVGNNIRITVKDDGSGFDTSGIGKVSKRAGGFGLLSIRERLNYLGGLFEIEAEKGQGTRVTIVAPRKRRKKRRGI